MTEWFFGAVQPVTVSMKLVDEQGDPYELDWRPELPRRPMYLRSVSVLDAAGVPVGEIGFSAEHHGAVQLRMPRVPEHVACPFCGGYVRGHQWIGEDSCSVVAVFIEQG